ncbi:MAG TPA: DUF2007 domain-containing protein [Anaerolineaceae bacterium]|nr:DUF2007 domain-containing protein [Anaerolineaceae bacterium]
MKKYKLLYKCYGMLDAKSIQLLLESFNIQSKAYQESAGVTLGLTVGGLGSANIFVKNEDFDDAQRIIFLMENGELVMPEVDMDEDSLPDDDILDLDIDD